MTAKSRLAANGIRLGTLGSLASLASVFPLTEGSADETAHTSAGRIGWYADRTAGAEKIGTVVMGTEVLSIGFVGGVARVAIPGLAASTTPTDGALVVSGGLGVGGSVRSGSMMEAYSGTAGAIKLEYDATRGGLSIGTNNTWVNSVAGLGGVMLGRDIQNFCPGSGTSNLIVGKSIGVTANASNLVLMGTSVTLGGSASSNGIVLANGGTFSAVNDSVIIGRPDGTAATAVLVGRVANVGTSGVAIGHSAVATGGNATAVGRSATSAGFSYGCAIGSGATCTAANQVMLGRSNERVQVPGTEAATSTTTGALRVAGGVGISGALYVGTRTGTATALAGFDANGRLIETTAAPGGATLTATQIGFGDGSNLLSGSPTLTYSATALTGGISTSNPIRFTRGLMTSASSTITGTEAWNNAGVAFTTVFFNVTDAASAASSLLMDLQVNSVSQFKVGKTGAVTAAGPLTAAGVSSVGAITAVASATQDGVRLQGRAGGTASYVGTLTPDALSASRTYTLPDADGTVALTSQLAGMITGTGVSGRVSYWTGTSTQGGDASFTYDPALTTGGLKVANTTTSTSTTTGALTVVGGAGVGGALWVGGTVNVRPAAGAATLNVLGATSDQDGIIYLGENGTAQMQVRYDGVNNRMSLGKSDNTNPILIDRDTGNTTVTGKISTGSTIYTTHQLNIGGNANAIYARRDNANGGGWQLDFVNAKPAMWFLTSGGAKLVKIGLTNQNVAGGENLVIGYGTGDPAATDLGIVMNATAGDVTITSVSASTSTTTGALRVAGGVGVAGTSYIASTITDSNAFHVSAGTANASSAGVHIDRPNANGAGSPGGIVLTQGNDVQRRLYLTGNDGTFSFNVGSYVNQAGILQFGAGMVGASTFVIGSASTRIVGNSITQVGAAMTMRVGSALTLTAAADTAGKDTYFTAESGGAHTSNNPRGGDIVFTPGAAGSGGTGRAGVIFVKGSLGVSDLAGVFTPGASIHVSRDTNSGVRADTYSNTGAAFPGIQLYKARGTRASPTAVQSGDPLGFLGAYGYGATGFSATSRASLSFYATENWTDAAHGTKAVIHTTPAGSVTPTDALTVWDTGIQVEAAGWVYWGDPTTDGSYRLGRSGADLVTEQRQSGSWVEVNRIVP
jgi:hypothetical protein